MLERWMPFRGYGEAPKLPGIVEYFRATLYIHRRGEEAKKCIPIL